MAICGQRSCRQEDIDPSDPAKASTTRTRTGPGEERPIHNESPDRLAAPATPRSVSIRPAQTNARKPSVPSVRPERSKAKSNDTLGTPTPATIRLAPRNANYLSVHPERSKAKSKDAPRTSTSASIRPAQTNARKRSVRPERSEAKSKGNNNSSLELIVVQDSRPGHDPFETFIANQSSGGHIRHLKQWYEGRPDPQHVTLSTCGW